LIPREPTSGCGVGGMGRRGSCVPAAQGKGSLSGKMSTSAEGPGYQREVHKEGKMRVVWKVTIEQTFGKEKYQFTENLVGNQDMYSFLFVQRHRWLNQQMDSLDCKDVKVISCEQTCILGDQ